MVDLVVSANPVSNGTNAKPAVTGRITEVEGQRFFFDTLPKSADDIDRIVGGGVSILFCIVPMEPGLETYAKNKFGPDGKVEVINARDCRFDMDDPEGMTRIAFAVLERAARSMKAVSVIFHDFQLPSMLFDKYNVALGREALYWRGVVDERANYQDMLGRVRNDDPQSLL